MFKFKGKIFSVILYFYLALPILIFFCGWIKAPYSIILVLVTLISLILSIKDDTANDAIINCLDGKKCIGPIIVISAIILLWVLLSGVGGYVYQNIDHRTRNSIMNELIHSKWPVLGYTYLDGMKQHKGMCYYFGFWLPSALIGKLFGPQLGNYALVLWTFLGVLLVVISICALVKKLDYKIALFFIFFSGLDYIRILLTGYSGAEIFNSQQIEWWNLLQYSSHTTQLFWVFNQCVYGWLATVLIFLQTKKSNLVFIMGALLFNSTFGFIGLIPYVLYFMIKGIRHINISFFREIFTFQNVLGGGCTGITTYLFLSGSTYAGLELNTGESSFVSYMIQVAIFILIEIGVYFFILWDSEKRNPLYIIMTLSLCVIPFFRLHDNYTNDFVMRASIPSLLVLMILLLQYLYSDKILKIKKVVLVLVFMIGCITPIHEFTRTISNIGTNYTNITLPKQRLLSSDNIANTPESFFWTHLAKNTSDVQQEFFKDIDLYNLTGYSDSEYDFVTVNERSAMTLSGVVDLHIYDKIENNIVVTLYCADTKDYDLNQIQLFMNGKTGQIEKTFGIGEYARTFKAEDIKTDENIIQIIIPDGIEVPIHYISIRNSN